MTVALRRIAALHVWALAVLFPGAPSAAVLTAAPPVVEGPTEADLEAEFRRARELLRSSPAFIGTGAQTRYRLAEELSRRGDMNGAAEEYRAAIGLDPDRQRPARSGNNSSIGNESITFSSVGVSKSLSA